MSSKTMIQAIREAQLEEMRRDPRVFIMGEDVETSFFGTTAGFKEEFGTERLRNTPISEAGFIGAAAGAAMVGMRPIVDAGLASFLYCAMDQIVSIIAKSTYLYGGQAKIPMVLRANMYYNNSFAAQHSDRPHPMFSSINGLKVIMPSTPYDFKGLLKSAIRDDDPVLCFEDGLLWTTRSEVPDTEYLIPLGQADIKRTGSDVTVVALGASVGLSLEVAEELETDGISVEVIDPRTLVPLDYPAVLASVAKTGRLVAVDMANRTCSMASEVAAIVSEQGFWDLKAPILRVTGPDIHIPFSPALEKGLFPTKERIAAAIRKVME